MNGGDALLSYWKDHREQLRQSENQRATLSNVTLVIVAALTGVMVSAHFAHATAFAAAVIALVGVFGAVGSAKYHERSQYHLDQARALTAAMLRLGLLPEVPELDAYRAQHASRFPRLQKMRLHIVWTAFHATVCVLGLVAAIVILLS